MANTQTDFYRTLGVKDDASEQQIKRAFRKLAKENHPDRHPGNVAKEKRFKEVSEAYETLSDNKKRAEYDNLKRYGAFAGGTPFGRGGAGAGAGTGQAGSYGSANFADLSDLFGSMFGAGGRGRRKSSVHFGGPFGFSGQEQSVPQSGADAASEITISFEDSLRGVSQQVTLTAPDGTRKTIKIKIPGGIENGEKIRLRGMGSPGLGGGPAGDLLLTINVREHQKFSRKGKDIYSRVAVSMKTAALGGKVMVDTLTKKIKLNIPPGTQPGARLRLKGQGLALGGKQGDQIVEIQVEIPKKLSKAQREALEKL
ncbi:MAG: J domain-containing protein [candidate division Zixibacteria bacterium]|nr:J domain-containing protein [candidate division Zixibacteria bacterium]